LIVLEREGKDGEFSSRILHWHFEARGKGIRFPPWPRKK